MDELKAVRAIYIARADELREVEAEAATLTRRALALREWLDSTRKLYPDIVTPADRDAQAIAAWETDADVQVISTPEAIAAIEKIMDKDPTRAWRTSHIKSALAGLGIKPPGRYVDSAVRGWLRAALHDGIVRRRKVDGRTYEYLYVPPEHRNDDGPAEAEPSMFSDQ